jgi:uncharacterized protein
MGPREGAVEPAQAPGELRSGRSCVFLDPNRIETFDGREDDGEDRWKTVGLVEPALLAVIYTVRGEDSEVIRLLSARKADSHEQAQYREI